MKAGKGDDGIWSVCFVFGIQSGTRRRKVVLRNPYADNSFRSRIPYFWNSKIAMTTLNKVFIATSIDGFIADANGGIDWLHAIPNPDNDDMGYLEFTSGIDAIVMGRNTFETVLGFDMDWPFQKPVFVLSDSLSAVPAKLKGKPVEIVSGSLRQVLAGIHDKGFHRLYIDGGKTIQGFLKEDLIDEMTITLIPVLLGSGIPLFSQLQGKLGFSCTASRIYLGTIVQNRFVRMR